MVEILFAGYGPASSLTFSDFCLEDALIPPTPWRPTNVFSCWQAATAAQKPARSGGFGGVPGFWGYMFDVLWISLQSFLTNIQPRPKNLANLQSLIHVACLAHAWVVQLRERVYKRRVAVQNATLDPWKQDCMRFPKIASRFFYHPICVWRSHFLNRLG